MKYENYYNIAFPLYLPSDLTYGAYENDLFSIGDYVLAEIGKKRIIGVIWSQTSQKNLNRIKHTHNIKPIIQKINIESLSNEMRYFIDWVSQYTLSNKGLVLRQTLSAKKAFDTPKLHKFYCLSDSKPSNVTKAVARVIDQLNNTPLLSHSDLIKKAKVSTHILNKMVEKQYLVLRTQSYEESRDIQNETFQNNAPPLSHEQKIIADKLINALNKKIFTCFLLDGITGSGKTEVYMQAIIDTLNKQKQILVMVPEILLTPDLIMRFEKYLNIKPTPWHSTLSDTKRADYWKGVNSGRIQLIIGARSALFLPYKNLGLIIVDEEHDSSYKQEDIVVYHARDMAIKKAALCNIVIILTSATPSIESYHNAKTKRYEHIILHNRYGESRLPNINTIDMTQKHNVTETNISPTLQNAIHNQKQKKEQTLLFLNRRGFSPLLLCQSCGFRFLCAHCDSTLVEHQKKSLLMCHYCGSVSQKPTICPHCDTHETMISCGAGVEKIAQEIRDIFPNYRYLIMSSDYNEGIKDMSDKICQIQNRDIDIIIGTQLAAKGHNFPYLTLVGIIDGDMGMDTNDPRANERCFQTLTQVAGRAGRSHKPGNVFIQSYQPDNTIITALKTNNREEFYNQELQLRKQAQLPPYTKLASIIISSPYPEVARKYAQTIKYTAENNPDIMLFGPAQAAIFKLRGRYRYRILLRTYKANILQIYIKNTLINLPKPAIHIRIQIDIDPINFL